MLQIEQTLRENPYIRKDSIDFWFSEFHQDCCIKNQTKEYCEDKLDFWGLWGKDELTCFDELGFKRKLFLFLNKNPKYVIDMRFNFTTIDLDQDKAFDHYYDGDWTVTASRAKFQYNTLENYTIKAAAMNSVKSELAKINFKTDELNDLAHPIPYTYIYLQLEANQIMSDELIRNLSLTFATILVVSLISIPNLQVSSKHLQRINILDFIILPTGLPYGIHMHSFHSY